MPDPANIWESLKRFVSGEWRKYALASISVVSFIVIWHLVSVYLHESGAALAPYIPYPYDVVHAFISSFTTPVPGAEVLMGTMIIASLKRILLGFGIAMLVAVPIGILMASFRLFEYTGKPIVELFRPIPPIAWVPVFMLAFRSFWGPVAIVFVGAFFPILLNVMFGVRSVDPVLMDAARTLGAKRSHIFTKVIIPSMLPYLMTGIKVGLGIAWMCIVAAEMIPVRSGGGLGYFIWVSSDLSRYDFTYATMLMIGILSILTTGVASRIERRVYRWMGMK